MPDDGFFRPKVQNVILIPSNRKEQKNMNSQIRMTTIKFFVHDTMKAKLKATAALNSMTMGDLFMDAVLEKYPYLKNEVGKGGNESNRQQFQHELEQILSELAHSADLSDRKKDMQKNKQLLFRTSKRP